MVVHRKPLQDGEFLPFELDLAQRRVLLLRLTEAQRASAPFLDERARPASAEAVWLPLQDVVEEGRASPSLGACWIFHIGHCGSTLLSRLLQSWPHLQVLREPLPLRSLAAAVCQGALSGREAATLGEQPGAPLLTMHRVGRTGEGRPVEIGEHIYRPSLYSFRFALFTS